MLFIGSIHLETNEGIQLCDPIYLGDSDNIRIPLQWPSGDYPIYYQPDGFLCILKSAKIEDVFWPIAGVWGDMPECVMVDSGSIAIAPASFNFDDDKHYQHFQARRSQLTFSEGRVVRPALILENVACAVTAYGDGEYPVFLDDSDSPMLIAIDTDAEELDDIEGAFDWEEN